MTHNVRDTMCNVSSGAYLPCFSTCNPEGTFSLKIIIDELLLRGSLLPSMDTCRPVSRQLIDESAASMSITVFATATNVHMFCTEQSMRVDDPVAQSSPPSCERPTHTSICQQCDITYPLLPSELVLLIVCCLADATECGRSTLGGTYQTYLSVKM